MKKIFAMLAVAASLLAVSCGKDDNGNGGSTKKPNSGEPTDLPASLSGSNYFPIILDAESAESIKSKIVLDLRPNTELDRRVDVWAAGETYTAGDAPGTNFYGTLGYTQLICAAPDRWSGGGITNAKADEVSKFADVAAHPDQYYFHLGYKGKANEAHLIRVFGLNGEADIYEFAVGQGSVNIDGTNHTAIAPKDGEFEAGEWVEYEFSIQEMGLNFGGTAPYVYIMTFLSGNNPGAELSLDAIFIYKK